MSMEVFQKILCELNGRDVAMKFVGQGEPMLHPKAVEMIRCAAAHGVVCHMTTNGCLLSEENIEELICSGLASLKFSFQGVDAKGYQEMRMRDDFEALYQRIALFYKMRGNRNYPFISVCTSITDETTEQVRAFREKFAPICDQVEVGLTTFEFIDAEKILDQQTKERFL